MTAGLNVIRPILVKTGAPSEGKVVIGTVKGDLHDIGKNLVKMMFEEQALKLSISESTSQPAHLWTQSERNLTS